MHEPKFKIGEHVTNGNTTGWITSVHTPVYYWVEDETGTTDRIAEGDLEYAKLSEEDAWLEVALMVGIAVKAWANLGSDYTRSQIRRKAYQILGGNGLDCNANHDAFKARINGLIERALKRG